MRLYLKHGYLRAKWHQDEFVNSNCGPRVRSRTVVGFGSENNLKKVGDYKYTHYVDENTIWLRSSAEVAGKVRKLEVLF